MNPANRFCQHCGQALEAGAQFCEACGAPVEPTGAPTPASIAPTYIPTPVVEVPSYQAPPPTYTPSPAYTPPPGPTPVTPVNNYGFPTEAPVKKKRTGLFLALGGLGCLCVICIGATIAGVSAVTRSSSTLMEDLQRSFPFITSVPFEGFDALPTGVFDSFPTIEPFGDLPTIEPFWEETPTVPDSSEPSVAVPPDLPPAATVIPPDSSNSSFTGQQSLTENAMFDDFSSTAMNWFVSKDEIGAHAYEDGGYTIEIVQAGYFVWSEVPVDFPLTTIEFDARVISFPENGIMGALCHFIDSDNNVYVGIDTDFQEYTVIRYVDGTGETLTSEDWVPATALKTDPYETNHYQVVCDPDMITLFVNGTFELQVELGTWTEPGLIALFTETYQDMPGEYKVFFDNMYAYRPAQ